MAGHRLGIDVGGTFTDAVLVDEHSREIRRAKVLSTPEDQSEGTLKAFGLFGVPSAEVSFFCHGSTVGINALIQRNGVKTGLLCTQGTRDLLDMGRLRRPLGDDLYDPTWQRAHQAKPLVHRRHVREVSARMLSDGSVYVELDEQEVRRQAAFLRQEGVQAVAVCLLHSWKNLEHEQRIVQIVREELPDAYVQSSAVRPVYGEYWRTLSCVLDAYTGPLIASYLRHLDRKLSADDFPGQVLIMQMNGGTRTLTETAENFPAYMLGSGPVAGALGAEHYARAYLDTSNLVCMDIGGTSTDIAFVVDGAAQVTDEWEFEFSMPLGMPAVDVRSFGAGGGSIIGVDEMGTLHVGPESAGASPGPAAYGRGGTRPTITDAYVALGIVQNGLFLGGELELDREAAVAALAPLAERLGLGVLELATGALRLMNVHIENEITKMAFERAIDLREYSLLAYGGAGAIHAAQVARGLGLREAIVPYFPGGFSALGMVTAPVKVERAKSIIEPLAELGADGLGAVIEELAGQVAADLGRQHVAADQIEVVMYGMYDGQSFDNRIVLELDGALSDEDLALWEDGFHAYYERIYGYSAREMAIIVTTVSVTGRSSMPALPIEPIAQGPPEPSADAVELRAPVHLEGQLIEEVPFLVRDRLLAGNRVDGPAVIDDGLSTTLVPVGFTAAIDQFGGIAIGHQSR
jgi:N-methylhydantoinase A